MGGPDSTLSHAQPFKSLSIVIPTYNRDKVLAKVLEAYVAQPCPELIHELVRVDDGSTDRTESLAPHACFAMLAGHLRSLSTATD
jgi:cellulose synthase/poly-beta-1,6-N-acetylglucosamine synthase-like glycosyltransferase